MSRPTLAGCFLRVKDNPETLIYRRRPPAKREADTAALAYGSDYKAFRIARDSIIKVTHKETSRPRRRVQ